MLCPYCFFWAASTLGDAISKIDDTSQEVNVLDNIVVMLNLNISDESFHFQTTVARPGIWDYAYHPQAIWDLAARSASAVSSKNGDYPPATAR